MIVSPKKMFSAKNNFINNFLFHQYQFSITNFFHQKILFTIFSSSPKTNSHKTKFPKTIKKIISAKKIHKKTYFLKKIKKKTYLTQKI